MQIEDLDDEIEPQSDEVAVINEPVGDKPARTAKPESKEVEYDGGKNIDKLVDAEKSKAAAEVGSKPAVAPVTTADQQKAVVRAWKAFLADKELDDTALSAMTADQLLKEVKIGYKANGQDQQRTFEQLIRVAQNGHYNEQRTQQLSQEREHALRQYRETAEKLTSYEQQRKVWENALTAASRNNFEPLKQILDLFQKAVEADPTAAPTVPEGYVSQAQIQSQQEANRVFITTVQPKAAELAKQFSYPQDQVEQAILMMVNREPSEFMSWQRLQDIMNVELPDYLTRLREANPVTPTEAETTKTELAALKQEIADLKSGKKTEVDTENERVTAVHAKRGKAPPGVPTVGGGSGGEGADFDDAAGGRKWLREYKG